MKLCRFGAEGQEKPGLFSRRWKHHRCLRFWRGLQRSFFANDGLKRLQSWFDQNKKNAPKVDPATRLGPALCRPSKIICIGLNYKDHAEEGGMEVPAEPIIFFKATSSFVGPNDPLLLPRGSEKTDWEVELSVVIGKKANYVSEAEALDYVAGYALHNDYSERAYQLERCGQWVKGKSCDTFAPFGPFMATQDEIEDVNNLRLWLKVNDVMKQDGNTKNLIFNVPFIVSYLSEFMSLLPGDIISTGTPAGVGLGFKPPQYLKAGDVVELGIEGLGSSRQEVIAP